VGLAVVQMALSQVSEHLSPLQVLVEIEHAACLHASSHVQALSPIWTSDFNIDKHAPCAVHDPLPIEVPLNELHAFNPVHELSPIEVPLKASHAILSVHELTPIEVPLKPLHANPSVHDPHPIAWTSSPKSQQLSATEQLPFPNLL
jgi:hypothetical protein